MAQRIIDHAYCICITRIETTANLYLLVNYLINLEHKSNSNMCNLLYHNWLINCYFTLSRFQLYRIFTRFPPPGTIKMAPMHRWIKPNTDLKKAHKKQKNKKQNKQKGKLHVHIPTWTQLALSQKIKHKRPNWNSCIKILIWHDLNNN